MTDVRQGGTAMVFPGTGADVLRRRGGVPGGQPAGTPPDGRRRQGAGYSGYDRCREAPDEYAEYARTRCR